MSDYVFDRRRGWLAKQDPLDAEECRNLAHALGLRDGAAQDLLKQATELDRLNAQDGRR